MALELNEEQQKEVDALIAQKAAEEAERKAADKLRELGFDEHARSVIAKANAEAKKHREEKEAIEKRASEVESQLKVLRDAEAARKAEEDRKAADEAARKKAEEDEKKSVSDRLREIEERHKKELKEIEDALERRLSEREKRSAEEQQKYLDDLKARDARILMQAVIAEAKEQGVIEEEVVRLLDVSSVKMEHGEPDTEAIKKLIEDHKTARPAFYKKPEDETTRNRDERGRFSTTTTDRPASKEKTATGGVDWGSLSEAEFARREEELRRTRV